jgi:hypothetical protein
MTNAAKMFEPLSVEERDTPSSSPSLDGWETVTPVPDDAPEKIPFHRLGKPGATWVYRNDAGKLLFLVCRFDKADGGKEVLPLTYCQDVYGNRDWRWRGYPQPRPLYGLDRLADPPDAPVLIVEGEKTADATQEYFPDHIVITNPGGSKAAGKAEWLPLKGRRVVIWPDHDVPGNQYAEDVLKLVNESGAASIAVVSVPEVFPEGWDLADDLPDGWDTEQIQNLLNSARHIAADAADAAPVEQPRPLLRELPPPDTFPLDALGDLLGDTARAIHDKVQAPEAICAQSVLAAATLAVQAHADVVLPTGQAKPISSFFLTIGATGERKSATDTEALWSIREYEKCLRETFGAAWPEHVNAREAWETQRKQILTNKKDYPDTAAKKAALDVIGREPQPPLLPMLTATDPTFEGLAKLFVDGQPSLGLFSAEGGQFIGGHGMSQEAKLRTAAGFSSLWDGDPIKRVRAGDGASILPGRRLAIHLMAQPDVAALMLSDRVLADQGMLSRVLVSSPASAVGNRLWREPKPESDTAIKRYGARLLYILELPLPLSDGKNNELAPRRINLSSEARRCWIAFVDHIEREMTGGLEPIQGLANKLPEHAARLATVLTLVENIESEEITLEQMAAGIEIAQYYASEGLRLFSAGHTDPDILLAQRTLEWLKREWHEEFVSLRVLYSLGPNPIRVSKTARRIAAILADHGWLIPTDQSVTVSGHRTKDAWRVVRSEP